MPDIHVDKILDAIINTKLDIDSNNADPALLTTANLVYDSLSNELNIVTDVGPITPYYTVTILPTPSDATVTLTATGYVQLNNTIRVPEGTVVAYTVSRTGYTSQSGSITVNDDQTIAVSLVINTYTVTLSVPTGATAYINGVARSSATLNYGEVYSWSVQRTNYLTASGSATLSSNTTITIAELTTNITPTPDTLTINSTSAIGAYFISGTQFSYTIVAIKANYNMLTLTGTVNQTSVVTGSMQIIYPFFESSGGSDITNIQQLYTTTITAETAGNYNITLKGGAYTTTVNASSTGTLQDITYYAGGGYGGIATCNVQLKAGAVVKIIRIGAQQDTLSHSGTWRGHNYGSNGIALLINNVVKLVAGGSGNGYLERYYQGTSGYRVSANAGGGGGYGGGSGTVNGLNYDGTAGNSSNQTAGTAYGGHGGYSTSSSVEGTQGKGGDGYIASDFTVNSETEYYKVNSLSCVGGSNWNGGSSGNNGVLYVSFTHE